MDPKDIITGLFYISSSTLVALISTWTLLKRVKSQNMKDDIGVAEEAMKMAADSVSQIQSLQNRVKQLEDMLNSGKYQMTLIAKLGELPEIKSVTIEKV